jgi:branched-chain amino acid transport system permease protein
LVLAAVVALPFLTQSRSTLNLVSTVAVTAVFGLSYNLLLGYAGIVSLGHAVFFGLGAYGAAIGMRTFGSSFGVLALGTVLALILATGLSLLVGYLSLRTKEIYYATLTLALGELMMIVAEKWRNLTGGADGVSFRIPEILRDRVVRYYVIVALVVLLFALVRLFLASPTGKALVAIRENEHRARALGFNVLRYKLVASLVAGVIACLAGVAYAVATGYVRTGVLGMETTLDALLVTIVGGVGTLYGPLVGAGVIALAREWLPELSRISPLFERWYILFGLLYIGIVLAMPGGVVGSLQAWWARRKVEVS